MRAALTIAALVLTAVVATAPSAQATFHGENGRIAFVSDRAGNYDIWTIEPDGSAPRQLTTSPGTDTRPAWSTDGTKIAFGSDRDGNFDVYVINADGTNEIRVTHEPTTEGHAAWSPDDRKLAFISDRDGDFEIYVMNADGTNQTRVTNTPGRDFAPRFSPDGRRILFTHADDFDHGPWNLRSIRVTGDDLVQLTADELQAGAGDWSPDGKRIVFVNNACSFCPESDVFVMDSDGRHPRQLTDNFGNNITPKFSPDGRNITWSHLAPPYDLPYELYTMKVNGTRFFNVTRNPAADDWGPDWGCAQDCAGH
jgi:Tol biopolymer transport system component